MIEAFNNERNLTQLNKIDVPEPNRAQNYGVIQMNEELSLNNVLNSLQFYSSKYPVSMENINIGQNYGQNFGFTVYRTDMPKGRAIKFTKGKNKNIQFDLINVLLIEGRVNDRAAVVVNNKQIDFIYAKNTSFSVTLPFNVSKQMQENMWTLDIVCENLGRVDYGRTLNDMNIQRKGLQENITIDGKTLSDWKLFAMDMKPEFIDRLKHYVWQPIQEYRSPAFYRTTLSIESTPEDTYLKLTNWSTSVVFINGFNIGRHWNIGPTKTLYVAAAFLKRGNNEIIIFETQRNANTIEFIDRPIL